MVSERNDGPMPYSCRLCERTPRTFFRRKLNGGDDDRAGDVRATAGSPPEASLPYPLFVSAGAVVGRRREIDTTDASGNDGNPFGYSDRRE